MPAAFAACKKSKQRLYLQQYVWGAASVGDAAENKPMNLIRVMPA